MTITRKTGDLIVKEGWKLFKEEGPNGMEYKVEAYGKIFPARHPALIHLKLYDEEENPDLKYLHLTAADRYLWPHLQATWNHWDEWSFREHCEDWNYIVYAGGASTGKSFRMARLADLTFLSNMKNNGVIISSTTLESLGARVWGYAMSLFSKMAVKIPILPVGGNSPKVLSPYSRSDGEVKDTLHGLFALAAKQGDAEKSISSWIGRHPNRMLMLVLDEATDINGKVIGAFANLDTGSKPFKCYAVGNSNSVDDLHGALATPAVGWDNIDPLKDKQWLTTKKKGTCLLFSCYDSPAILEQDPVKKKALKEFLITEEQINAKKLELGADSDSFWRFVIGFWRHRSTENVVASKQFIEGFQAHKSAHYGGIQEVDVVAGLDIAMSSGGDDCILCLAVLGIDVTGLHVLDFRDGEMTFKIPILRTSKDDASIQIVKQVLNVLKRFNIPLNRLVLDATGQGRAMPAVFQQTDNMGMRPIGVYSTKNGNTQKESFDVKIKSTYDLHNDLKSYILTGQIRGIPSDIITQLSERKVEKLPGGKMVLEAKKDYKVRMNAKQPGKGHSPDKADAAALTLQSAIYSYGFALGAKSALPNITDFGTLKYIAYQGEQREEENRVEQARRVYVPKASFSSSSLGMKPRKIF